MVNDYIYLKPIKQVYIEVTNSCNLACKYCYAIQRNQKATYFSERLFKNIIDKIAIYAEGDEIEIIFHGGEPLLKSPKYYFTLFSYARKKLLENGKTVDFGIQSNLTLFNDDFLELFKEFDVKVSTSIDGNEASHNSARSDWKKTIENFSKIKDSGISISPIAVVSQHNWDKIEEICELFKALNVYRFQINIATSMHKHTTESVFTPLSSTQILQVYKDTLSNCIKYNIIEEKMKGMIKRYLKKPDWEVLSKTLGCDYPFCHAGTEMIVFTPDGNMYPCSPCVALSQLNVDFSLGIFGEKINKIDYLNNLAKFHTKDHKYSSVCSNCEAAQICEFNCPGFDRLDSITRENKCKAIQLFFKELLNYRVKDLENLITD